jgi:hypothetical protein
MIKLIAALALAAAAPVQQDVYEASWSSSHWSLLAIDGDAGERVAVLVDRDSIRTGASVNLREFNLLSTVEGMGRRWGIVAHIRVDCDARQYMELGRVSFLAEGRRDPTPPTDMVSISPDSGLYRALGGICRGDWNGFTSIDVAGSIVPLKVFEQ